jgi:drug/metabolite transporter (DMT)-like permease
LPSTESLLAATGLAIPAPAIAYFFYFKTIDRAGATNAMLVAFIMPVIAVMLGIAFLGEVLTGGQIVGALLIAAGLVAIDGRLLARFRNVP